MKRIIIVSAALWFVLSCGGKEEGPARDSKPVGEPKKPVQMIVEDELTEFEKLANGYIRPYFDADATQSEKTVKLGETFDLYVFAELSPLYTVSAAEYCLVLPAGVTVLSSANSDSTILTLGKHEEDFMIAFRCTKGPKHRLVRYSCVANAGVPGGTIGIEAGRNLHFLGFTLCDEMRTMIRARAGQAVLKIE